MAAGLLGELYGSVRYAQQTEERPLRQCGDSEEHTACGDVSRMLSPTKVRNDQCLQVQLTALVVSILLTLTAGDARVHDDVLTAWPHPGDAHERRTVNCKCS